jgi:hypothetical protein
MERPNSRSRYREIRKDNQQEEDTKMEEVSSLASAETEDKAKARVRERPPRERVLREGDTDSPRRARETRERPPRERMREPRVNTEVPDKSKEEATSTLVPTAKPAIPEVTPQLNNTNSFLVQIIGQIESCEVCDYKMN